MLQFISAPALNLNLIWLKTRPVFHAASIQLGINILYNVNAPLELSLTV